MCCGDQRTMSSPPSVSRLLHYRESSGRRLSGCYCGGNGHRAILAAPRGASGLPRWGAPVSGFLDREGAAAMGNVYCRMATNAGGSISSGVWSTADLFLPPLLDGPEPLRGSPEGLSPPRPMEPIAPRSRLRGVSFVPPLGPAVASGAIFFGPRGFTHRGALHPLSSRPL